ncbi:MAG: ribosome-associated translation inhibitor RaiA [Erysipelothrix sp.]|nr:ribosome-associated translation inhibitor RaiA [Erysipelothrix sp.]
MKVNVRGKNVDITDGMRTRAESKLEFLDRYIAVDDETVANVLVKIYSSYHKVEVTIATKIGLLRAEAVADDYYSAIDVALDKLEKQIKKHKSRLTDHHKDSLVTEFLEQTDKEDAVVQELVRTKSIDAEVMTLDEAILMMEMLGHTFFLYTDDETNRVALVYKRDQGGYGLLET